MLKEASPILITGAAGFIGAALAKELLKRGENVIGIDNLNDYYDVNLKLARLNQIEKIVSRKKCNWNFYKNSLTQNSDLETIFKKYKPQIVVNLAAQAGVRYSLENPKSYIDNNLIGFFNLLENCKNYKIKNLIYASSSSVYGGNRYLPYSEKHQVNHPVSLYAVTKKSNEIMAHSYSHLYGLSITGLRFFTVYGPWGRPDMAPMIFSKAILKGNPIDVYNFGNMKRDFTFIDDVVEVVCRCCKKPAVKDESFDPANPNPSTSFAPHRLFNVGNSNPIKLIEFINLLENFLGTKAIKNLKKMQDGDVFETAADTTLLSEWIDFIPNTKIEDGMEIFTKWYIDYFKLSKNHP